MSNLIGDVLGVRETARQQSGVLLQVLEVLGERQTDALGDAAVHLAVDDQLVVDLAHVAHGSVSLHRGLAGPSVHRHFGHEHAVHVDGERTALRISRRSGVHRGRPLAGVPHGMFSATISS